MINYRRRRTENYKVNLSLLGYYFTINLNIFAIFKVSLFIYLYFLYLFLPYNSCIFIKCTFELSIQLPFVAILIIVNDIFI